MLEQRVLVGVGHKLGPILLLAVLVHQVHCRFLRGEVLTGITLGASEDVLLFALLILGAVIIGLRDDRTDGVGLAIVGDRLFAVGDLASESRV